MKMINNIKIRNKLILMIIFPLIGLIYLGVDSVIDKSRAASELAAVGQLAKFSAVVSELIHETQKERGATAIYVNSQGSRFSSEMISQRKDSDSKRTAFKAFMEQFDATGYGSKFKVAVSKATGDLDILDARRRSISSLSISTKEAIAYYTNMHAAFLDAVGIIPTLSGNAEITTNALAYHSFLMSKERAGIERAIVSASIAADKFAEGMFAKFIKITTAQEVYAGVFVAYASDEAVQTYRKAMQDPSVAEVERMRKIVTDKAAVGGFGIEADYWFKTITQKINRLKETDDYLANALRERADYLHSEAVTLQTIFSVLIGLILVLTLYLAWLITRGIVAPITEISKVAELIAVGEIQHEIKLDSRDEIGGLASSFRKMIDYMHELSGAADRIADGDLTVRIEAKSEDDALGNAFAKMVVSLSTLIKQLHSNSGELVTAATEISSTSEQMAKGAQIQSDQVTQVTTAIEEMSATIIESSRNAGEAKDASNSASSTAEEGGRVVGETITGIQQIATVVRDSAESITKLAKSADQIGEIIGVIDDIADQTNLLALNAAIEAARAGEQGRGFAVVADEVRKLAERTGKATGEITNMIKGIQAETGQAVKSMETGIIEVNRGREMADKAGNSLNEIVNITGRVLDMIQQIASATEEQSAAADEISKNMESISSVTKETASGAEQSSAAAEQLNRQAESLKNMVAQFKV